VGELAVVVVVVAVACGRPSGIESGHAFERVFATRAGFATLPPGGRLGALDIYLHNVSSSVVTIRHLVPIGTGVGSVISETRVRAVPERGGIHAMPGGGYTSDPPVFSIDGVCHVPTLRPLSGFSLPPDGTMRVWMVLRALAPGRYVVTAHRVVFRENGETFAQVIPTGYEGRVVAGATPPRPDHGVRPCLSRTSELNPASA
jgi:hypothetical protein